MFDRQGQTPNHSQHFSQGWGRPLLLVWALVMALGLGGCQSLSASEPSPLVKPVATITVGNLQEVSPPKTIQALGADFNQYQPQVAIVAPAPDAVLNKTTVAVQLQVRDFPFNADGDVALRPHLHLILDNEPYRAIYDPTPAIALEDLEPGTHTLRVFPVRPWHESYKNDGAYAQVTFHVLTKTDSNNPDPGVPLLTYSRPKGDYGAEPILLDYYLTNAPLHLAAATDETLADWRIRVTINDQSFLLDQWQPIYLSGFNVGENWVKLEFIDEQGNLVPNRFNNTVRVINYQPGGEDGLSRLMRGDGTLAEAYALTGLTLPEFLAGAEERIEITESETLKMTASPAEIPLPEPLEASDQPEEGETNINSGVPASEASESLPNPLESPSPQASSTEELPTQADTAAIAPLEESMEVLEETFKPKIPVESTGDEHGA